MARATTPPRYALVGGRLCLDFCNTARDRGGSARDRLTGYSELVGWSWQAGIFGAEEAVRLRQAARRGPTDKVAVFRRAVKLRKALYDVFASAAGGRTPPPAALEVLNSELGRAMARSQVVTAEGGFTWVWEESGRALDSMLWPIARSAADLLTSAELTTVRQCRGSGCGWLFLDTSRNRTRRWCDMRVCGNRAKARRHHERARAAGAA